MLISWFVWGENCLYWCTLYLDLVVLVKDFRMETFFVLWIGCSMLSCEWVWNFIAKVIFVKWVCMLSVCHERSVVRWAEKLPVSSERLPFCLQFYFD